MTEPKKWDPDPNDPALTATTGVPHELGGVLRPARLGRKGAALIQLLNSTEQKIVAASQIATEQEREALAAGRTVYAGSVKEGTK
ncbi:hypothetical protein [Mycolicibacterium houstonense]|uniref:hypothetical protein n=1 Tax=Mycolicibacterium houstonense TaxID=146021 RepID=UPI00083747E3|nr:hypothetical protein [Mycolicibacterium houstonense]